MILNGIIFIIVSMWILNYIIVFLWLLVKGKYDNNKRKSYVKEEISIVYVNTEGYLKTLVRDLFVGLEMYKIKQIGKIPTHIIRKIFYKFAGMKIERNVVIYGGCEFRATHKIEIGQGTIIGNNCSLDGRNGIYVGKNVNFSTGVSIWTEQHDPQDVDFGCDPKKYKKVIIKDRVWLSNNCTILPGVIVGEGAVVAASSVVTKDVEPYAIYAGIPAKKIGERNRDLKYEFNGSHLWFI